MAILKKREPLEVVVDDNKIEEILKQTNRAIVKLTELLQDVQEATKEMNEAALKSLKTSRELTKTLDRAELAQRRSIIRN